MTNGGEPRPAEPVRRRSRAPRMPRPPEVAAADIERLFDRIRTIAPPGNVDAAWSRSFGLADASIVLNWLGIAIDGRVEDQALWNRVRLPATRQEALAERVRHAYARVFDQVEVSEATREDLEGAFANEYSLGDTGRYIRAFAALCRQAGIAVPAVQPRAAAPAATEGTAAPRQAPTRTPRPRTPAAPTSARREETRRRTADPSQTGVSVSIVILPEWTEDEIRDRVAAVRRALSDAETS